MSLLLAPYNNSMRLGQGYNSFLHIPCMENAVETADRQDKSSTRSEPNTSGIPQVVSYTCRFVDKMSDIVHGMNVSAGSAIKNGSVQVAGSSLGVDELKVATSDLNAVVAVKVINRMINSSAGSYRRV